MSNENENVGQVDQVEANEDGNGGRVRVTMESFIETWENVANSKSPSVQAVADALGLKKESVQQRATKYRTKHGVALTNMPRGGGAKFKTEDAKELLAKLKAERVNRLNSNS